MILEFLCLIINKAFQVTTKNLAGTNDDRLHYVAARVYQDYLYIYGKKQVRRGYHGEVTGNHDELWSFDLSIIYVLQNIHFNNR